MFTYVGGLVAFQLSVYFRLMQLSRDNADRSIRNLPLCEISSSELKPAGVGRRVLAYSLDSLLICLLIIFLLVVIDRVVPSIRHSTTKWVDQTSGQVMRSALAGTLTLPSLGTVPKLVLALFVFAQYVLECGYFIFWEVMTGGRSPGKIAIGLRVVRQHGLQLDLRSSIARNIMRIVDMLPVDYAVGLVSILLSTNRQRLGDHVAGTIVIRLEPAEHLRRIASPDVAHQHTAAAD